MPTSPTGQCAIAAVHTLLETYRDPGVPGGYKYFTDQLKASDATKLSKSIQALQEPLSKIAEKVATAGQEHHI